MKKIIILCCAFLSAQAWHVSDLMTLFKRRAIKQEVVHQATPQKATVAIFDFNDKFDLATTLSSLFIASKDPSIQALLFIIDNNGGEAGAFSAIHDTIQAIKTKKPVVGLITSSALSGGYWVASACDYLIAHAGSNIGHIGVFMQLTRYKNTKLGGNSTLQADVTYEFITAGEMKIIHNPLAPELTYEQRAYLEEECQKTYQQFLKTVAKNRNVSLDAYKAWADAKIFSGHEAQQLGLVDCVGTLFDAETKILELIKNNQPETQWSSELGQVVFKTMPGQ